MGRVRVMVRNKHKTPCESSGDHKGGGACLELILAFRKSSQKHCHEFGARLDYMMRHSLQKTSIKPTKASSVVCKYHSMLST